MCRSCCIIPGHLAFVLCIVSFCSTRFVSVSPRLYQTHRNTIMHPEPPSLRRPVSSPERVGSILVLRIVASFFPLCRPHSLTLHHTQDRWCILSQPGPMDPSCPGPSSRGCTQIIHRVRSPLRPWDAANWDHRYSQHLSEAFY